MMCPFFLSALEIQQLTGLRRPSAQRNWLQKHGWKHDVNAIGRPVIAIAEAERKLVGSTAKNLTGKEPNWGAING